MAMSQSIVLDGLRSRRDRKLWKSYRRQHLEDLNSSWNSNFQSILSRRNHELCGHYRGYFDTPSKELSNGDIRRDRSERAFNNTLGSSATSSLCMHLPRRKYNSRDPEDVSGTNEMVGVFNTVRAESADHVIRPGHRCKRSKADSEHCCTRTVDWDLRHQMCASAMNDVVHGHYRNWFDRPVLMSTEGHPLSPRASHAKYHKERSLAETRKKDMKTVCSTTMRPHQRKLNDANRVRLFQELSPLAHHSTLLANQEKQQASRKSSTHSAASIKKALEESIQ